MSEGVAVKEEIVANGAKILSPKLAPKEGYIFDGWYKDDMLTVAWNFATDVVTANVTLYAKWNAAENGNGVVKLLEKIRFYDDFNDDDYWIEFEYDDQNRITKVSWLNVYMAMTYSGDDLIKVTWSGEENPDEFYENELEFIKSGNTLTYTEGDFSTTILTLNSDGYLTNFLLEYKSDYDDDSSSETIYQYLEGNLIKTIENYNEYEIVFEFGYDDKKSPFYYTQTPKWFLIWWFLVDDMDFGLKNNIIEIKYSGSDGIFIQKYEYEYDGDGFPTKRTRTYYNDGEQYASTVYFTYITR